MIGDVDAEFAEGMTRDRQPAPIDRETAACRALIAEVIHTAVVDATSRGETAAARRGAAQRWIFSDDPAPQSYIWFCELIGIDPEAARDRLVDKHGRRILEGLAGP